MNLQFVIIFIICIFIFIHIKHQYKITEEQNNILYPIQTEIDTKDAIETMFENRLPCVFLNSKMNDCNGFTIKQLQTKSQQSTIQFPVCNIQYLKNKQILKSNTDNTDTDNTEEDVSINDNTNIIWKLDTKKQIDVDINTLLTLFNQEDTYITEYNETYIPDTLLTYIKEYDGFYRPPLNWDRECNILTGSIGSTTPLMFSTNNRTLLVCTNKNIRIRLIHPTHTKHFTQNSSYRHHYIYNENIWNINKTSKINEIIPFHEIDIEQGNILSIPPFWLYTIQYTHGLESNCIRVEYTPIMNIISSFVYKSKKYIETIFPSV